MKLLRKTEKNRIQEIHWKAMMASNEKLYQFEPLPHCQ